MTSILDQLQKLNLMQTIADIENMDKQPSLWYGHFKSINGREPTQEEIDLELAGLYDTLNWLDTHE
jgi:hypothetical protein